MYLLGQILFNTFISDIKGRIECTLSKFESNIKLNGGADFLEGKDIIQKDLDRFKERSRVNSMTFNNTKCKVLHLSQGSLQYQYRLRD